MENEEIKPEIEKIGNEIEYTEPKFECYVYIVSAIFIHGFVSKFDFDKWYMTRIWIFEFDFSSSTNSSSPPSCC
jgi:hypothetical protein